MKKPLYDVQEPYGQKSLFAKHHPYILWFCPHERYQNFPMKLSPGAK